MLNPRDVIIEAALQAPLEACGITLGGIAVPLTNVAARPSVTFKVNADELQAAIIAGDGKLWDGVWHSHPDGETRPSEDDLAWHPPGKRLYIVAGTRVYEYTWEGELKAVLDGE